MSWIPQTIPNQLFQNRIPPWCGRRTVSKDHQVYNSRNGLEEREEFIDLSPQPFGLYTKPYPPSIFLSLSRQTFCPCTDLFYLGPFFPPSFLHASQAPPSSPLPFLASYYLVAKSFLCFHLTISSPPSFLFRLAFPPTHTPSPFHFESYSPEDNDENQGGSRGIPRNLLRYLMATQSFRRHF